MKPLKQIVSALTAAAMSLSLLTGILPAKAVEEPASENGTNSDLSMTAENSLGQLMLDASQQDPSEDAGEYDGSAGVTGIVIEDGKADISYYTPVKADLVLAFYSDDETQMYASLNAEVAPAEPADDGTPGDQNQTYTFTVPTDIPSYYVVKAYLIGAAFTPLCEAYSTNLYTESITKARNSKPSDYDPSLVVNLDENTDHNFLVLREETVQITYDGRHNLLDSYDEATGAYHFTNADTQLTSLQKGDVVYYDYSGGGDKLIFRVVSCSTDETGVTVESEQTDLTEAFSVMNVQSIEPLTSGLEVGKTYNGTLTYLGSEEVDAAESEPIIDSLHPLAGKPVNIPLIKDTFTLTLTDDILEDMGIEDAKIGVFEGELTGSLIGEISVCSALQFDLISGEDSTIYTSIKLINNFSFPKLSVDFTAEGRYVIWSKSVKLGAVGCEAEISIGIELSGSYHRELFSASLTQETEVQVPILDSWGKEPKVYATPVNANWDVDKQTEVLSMGGYAKAECKFTKDFKVTIKAELLREFERVESEGLSSDILKREYDHICKNCHQWSLSYEAKIGVKIKLPKVGNIDPSISRPILDPKWTAAEWYISHDFNEIEFGKCPHKAYAIQLYADDNGTMLPDLEILIERKTEDGLQPVCTLRTNEDGRSAVMAEAGIYHISAEYNGKTQTVVFDHADRCQVCDLHMAAEEPATEPPTESDPDKGTILYSGTCGTEDDPVTWKLDDNGTLWISGSGTIPYSSTPPWAEYADTITRIVIGSGITEIFARVFADLGHITGITLPEGLKTIGSRAFENCTALSSVILPDSLESICDNSFAGCSSLRTITIPKHVTTIVGTGTPFPINMTDIQVDPENPAYSDVDGVLFNKEQTMLLYFPPGRTGDYTVPDGVEKIGFSKDEQGSVAFCAFRCCNLTSITLPDSVNYLCAHAFNACHQLESVRLSENLEKIPYYAFSSCYELKDMTLPDGVIEIKPMAFESALRGSVTVPGSVKTVGTKAFYRSPLNELIFEEGVETIDGSFRENTYLRTVYLPASLKSLKNTFNQCVNVKDVYYGGTEEQWKALGLENEFAYKTYLGNTNIHIGVSAATLGSDTTLPVSGLIKAGSLNEQTAEFTDLAPNTTYILYSVADKNAEQPLSPANLLYINQYTADENGCISADFTPVRDVDGAETFVIPVPVAELEPEETTLGDVNGDGTVNASDAAQILIAAAAIGAGNDSGLTAEQEAVADVNGDGSINASDAAVVLIYAAAIGAGQDVKLTDFVK